MMMATKWTMEGMVLGCGKARGKLVFRGGGGETGGERRVIDMKCIWETKQSYSVELAIRRYSFFFLQILPQQCLVLSQRVCVVDEEVANLIVLLLLLYLIF